MNYENAELNRVKGVLLDQFTLGVDYGKLEKEKLKR